MARNVISGNAGNGVELVNTTGNDVKGNYIGTDKTGLVVLGNGLDGVHLGDASNNVIGGTVAGSRNVISGNALDGVSISGGNTNRVLRNSIGVSATVARVLPNGGNGVQILGGASGNRIGSSAAGTGNIIAYNALAGVRIESGTGNAVRGNSNFGNDGLGIDLVGPVAGVTENDTDDPDVGANDLQNFPKLDFARPTALGIWVQGSINTEANQILRLDFYLSLGEDVHPSLHGPGRRYLGFITVDMGTGTTAEFSELLLVSGVQAGDVVTATATDEKGNTSEFSIAMELAMT